MVVVVPEKSLQKLKCSNCNEYLSTSPIMLKSNGDNICGKCIDPEDEDSFKNFIRNTMYEELAILVCFPCCYMHKGCSKKLPLDEISLHEKNCEYKTLECPMSDLKNCDWLGSVCELKEHFEGNHNPFLIVHYPCQLNINIRKNYESYYLLEVFGSFFLFQMQCNIVGAKLWYCVRYIGNSNYANNFNYIIDVGNDKGRIKKERSVESNQTILLSSSKVIEVDISSLLKMIDNCDIEYITCKVIVELRNPNCLICNGDKQLQKIYLEINGYICADCQQLEHRIVENDNAKLDFLSTVHRFYGFIEKCSKRHKFMQREKASKIYLLLTGAAVSIFFVFCRTRFVNYLVTCSKFNLPNPNSQLPIAKVTKQFFHYY